MLVAGEASDVVQHVVDQFARPGVVQLMTHLCELQVTLAHKQLLCGVKELGS